jgi:hypothetical protein
MEERRKIRRTHIMCYSRIFDRRSGELVGFLNDITPQGMNILSDILLQSGKIYRFRIDLPEYVFGRNHLDLEGGCKWSRRDIDPNFYVAGFELLDVTEEEAQIIQQLNQEYELNR